MTGVILLESAGAGIDHELWAKLIKTDDAYLVNELWHTTCLGVASRAIQKGQYVDHESPEGLLKEWMDETLPRTDDLIMILGEADYFQDMLEGGEWDLMFSFCGTPVDVDQTLRYALTDATSNPEAEDAITDDVIVSFYTFWRSRFLRRVVQEALGPSDI